MVMLRLGKINNEEKKFIPTKKEFLDKYLNEINCIEEYILTQTYKDGYKYREYNDEGELKYTKNKKMNKITEVVEITKEEFYEVLKSNNYNCIRKIRKYYIDGDYEIDVDIFMEPVKITMVEVSSNKPLDKYNPPKGFVDVSDINAFENLSIYNGSIKSNNIIIEGTDGVGKTVTVEKLLSKGIICQDRSVEKVSNYMFFNINMKTRAKKIEQFLLNNNIIIIILINNDKKELESRINLRKVISEYDLDAFKYNKLYLDTYNYMKKQNMLHNRLFLVDCTHLTIDEQVSQVEKIILYKNNLL